MLRQASTQVLNAALLAEEGGGLLGDAWQYILLLAGGLLFMFLLFRLSSRRLEAVRQRMELERHAGPGAAAGPRRAAPSPPRGDPGVEQLMVDLQDFSREMEGRLDTKISYLRGLIREADRVADRLEALVEAQGGELQGSPVPSRRGVEEATEAGESEGKGETRGSETSQAEGAEADATLGQRLDITVGDEQPDAAADASLPGDDDATRRRVIELHEEGRKPQEIATEVGLPKGEIELIINLHQSSSSRPG